MYQTNYNIVMIIPIKTSHICYCMNTRKNTHFAFTCFLPVSAHVISQDFFFMLLFSSELLTKLFGIKMLEKK